MKKLYSLFLLALCLLSTNVAAKGYIYCCPDAIWSNWQTKPTSMKINYQDKNGTWHNPEMKKTSSIYDGKAIWGVEVDEVPSSCQFWPNGYSNDGNRYDATGASDGKVLLGWKDNSHQWIDCPAPHNAASVAFCGSFNNWSTTSHMLTKVDGNHYTGVFEIPGASNNYTFKLYVVDAATSWGSFFSVPNNFWFTKNVSTANNGLYVNNGDNQIQCISSSETKSIRVFVEYFGTYSGKGYLKVEQSLENTIVSDVVANKVGTVCYPNKMFPKSGATFYKAVSRDNAVVEQVTKIDFEKVDVLEAGMPYIYIAEGGDVVIYEASEVATEAGSLNGMVGTFTRIEDANETSASNVLEGNYAIASNQIIKCGYGCKLAANRAYIVMENVPYAAPTQAAGRISLGMQGANTATGLDDVENNDIKKMMIDGVLFIFHNGKTYDAFGRQVK